MRWVIGIKQDVTVEHVDYILKALITLSGFYLLYSRKLRVSVFFI